MSMTAGYSRRRGRRGPSRSRDLPGIARSRSVDTRSRHRYSRPIPRDAQVAWSTAMPPVSPLRGPGQRQSSPATAEFAGSAALRARGQPWCTEVVVETIATASPRDLAGRDEHRDHQVHLQMYRPAGTGRPRSAVRRRRRRRRPLRAAPRDRARLADHGAAAPRRTAPSSWTSNPGAPRIGTRATDWRYRVRPVQSSSGRAPRAALG